MNIVGQSKTDIPGEMDNFAENMLLATSAVSVRCKLFYDQLRTPKRFWKVALFVGAEKKRGIT